MNNITENLLSSQEPPDFSKSIYRIRMVIVGEAGVGKTNLATAWTEGEIRNDLKSTIGIDFFSKRISLGEIFLNI